jgi:DNA-binding GntR family transcriptional regulator
MATHGVALGTAQAAVRILEREGRVRVEHGKGTIVLDRTAPRPAASQLRELREELVALKAEARRAVAVVSDLEGRIGTLADRIELEA